MARPIKTGIDYFSLDTDFYENKKIKLLRGEFGMAGVGLYLTALAQIYGSRGYYMVWDNDECLLMSQGAAGGCSPNLIKEVITGCLRCSLFDKRVFEVFGVLTSSEIQRRYLEAVGKRSRITMIKEYWLLDVNDEEDVSANVLKRLVFKSVSGEITPINSEKTQVNTESMLQRRSDKTRVDKIRSSPRARNDTRNDTRNEPLAGNRSDDDFDDETKRQIKRIEDAVVRRSLSSKELNNIRTLVSRYGTESLRRGIDAAVKAGGRSVSYVGKCVESSYMDTLADIAINKENSQYEMYIAECMAQGMTREQAEDAANFDFFFMQPMQDAAGGALSGVGFGVGGSAIGDINTRAYGAGLDANNVARQLLRSVYGSANSFKISVCNKRVEVGDVEIFIEVNGVINAIIISGPQQIIYPLQTIDLIFREVHVQLDEAQPQ